MIFWSFELVALVCQTIIICFKINSKHIGNKQYHVYIKTNFNTHVPEKTYSFNFQNKHESEIEQVKWTNNQFRVMKQMKTSKKHYLFFKHEKLAIARIINKKQYNKSVNKTKNSETTNSKYKHNVLINKE